MRNKNLRNINILKNKLKEITHINIIGPTLTQWKSVWL